MTDNVKLRAVVFVLGLIGFLVAAYIYRQKKKNEPLICLVGFDCEGVIKSRFSAVFGIPLEVLGMIYYGAMAIVYFLLLFVMAEMPGLLAVLLPLGSFAAFLFSVYLLVVQIFILKKGCSWCFLSAFVSILIFIATVFAYGLFDLIRNYIY